MEANKLFENTLFIEKLSVNSFLIKKESVCEFINN